MRRCSPLSDTSSPTGSACQAAPDPVSRPVETPREPPRTASDPRKLRRYQHRRCEGRCSVALLSLARRGLSPGYSALIRDRLNRPTPGRSQDQSPALPQTPPWPGHIDVPSNTDSPSRNGPPALAERPSPRPGIPQSRLRTFPDHLGLHPGAYGPLPNPGFAAEFAGTPSRRNHCPSPTSSSAPVPDVTPDCRDRLVRPPSDTWQPPQIALYRSS